jgi:pyridoxal phosphate enzyme (YggS family)
MTIDYQAIRDAARQIFERVEASCARSGRDRRSVQVVGISKKQPPEVWSAWSDACFEHGQRCIIGENYVQEFAKKRPALPDGCEAHFTGTLQSNKTEVAVELFDVLETVHSEKLLKKVDLAAARLGKIQRILLEVNVSRDPAKSGFLPEEIDRLVDGGILQAMVNLDVCGLMTITALHPSAEGARADFAALSELSERYRAVIGRELSMGMSGDFEVAIEEGATLVRIGTALFGERA